MVNIYKEMTIVVDHLDPSQKLTTVQYKMVKGTLS